MAKYNEGGNTTETQEITGIGKQMYLYDIYQLNKTAKMAGLLFLGTLAFLFFFKPFVVNEAELKYSYLFTCLVHALSPALIFIGYFKIAGYLKNEDLLNDRQLTSYLLFSLVGVFSIIGVVSFLLRDLIYNNPDNWSLRYLWEEIRNTYLAGALFCSYFLFANYYFRSQENRKQEYNVQEIKENDIQAQPDVIFIKTHVRMDDFNFNPSIFLFARAEGNYIELTTRNGDGLKKELKRISLKQFESQISGIDKLIRCHRTYLVNIGQVNHVTGNSQGYLLSFQGTAEKIPVSRTNLGIFDRLYVETETG